MPQSLQFIKDRAVQTVAAARQLASTWTWQEKTPDQHQAALAGIVGDPAKKLVGQETLTQSAEQAMRAARAAWDVALDRLHVWTVQGVGLARTRFRDDPARTAQLQPLTSRADSRSATLSEASDWEAAWTSVDPQWVPVGENTLAAFRKLRESCNGPLRTAYAEARAQWRQQAAQLNALAAQLEDLNEAWYADATRVFPAGTPEGDMIRSTVPTTYTRPSEDDDEPVAPTTPGAAS